MKCISFNLVLNSNVFLASQSTVVDEWKKHRSQFFITQNCYCKSKDLSSKLERQSGCVVSLSKNLNSLAGRDKKTWKFGSNTFRWFHSRVTISSAKTTDTQKWKFISTYLLVLRSGEFNHLYNDSKLII